MNRPRIIAICNRKGGTGKTNIAVNLGAYLAHFGKKVLLVDLDPQANATSGLGVEKTKQGIYEVLSEKISPHSSLIGARKDFWLIPSNENLAGADVEMVGLEGREAILAKKLGSLLNYDLGKEKKEDFDFVFIDTPPSLGLITVNSLVAADYALIPVQAEYYALEGLGQLLQTISLVRENLQPRLDILGAVLTMYDTRSRLSEEVWNELYKHFPHRIFRTVIPRNVSLAEAPSYGQTILEYAPDSKGAKAYHRLAREFLSL